MLLMDEMHGCTYLGIIYRFEAGFGCVTPGCSGSLFDQVAAYPTVGTISKVWCDHEESAYRNDRRRNNS
jgi:hypothetical protein